MTATVTRLDEGTHVAAGQANTFEQANTTWFKIDWDDPASTASEGIFVGNNKVIHISIGTITTNPATNQLEVKLQALNPDGEWRDLQQAVTSLDFTISTAGAITGQTITFENAPQMIRLKQVGTNPSAVDINFWVEVQRLQ